MTRHFGTHHGQSHEATGVVHTTPTSQNVSHPNVASTGHPAIQPNTPCGRQSTPAGSNGTDLPLSAARAHVCTCQYKSDFILTCDSCVVCFPICCLLLGRVPSTKLWFCSKCRQTLQRENPRRLVQGRFGLDSAPVYQHQPARGRQTEVVRLERALYGENSKGKTAGKEVRTFESVKLATLYLQCNPGALLSLRTLGIRIKSGRDGIVWSAFVQKFALKKPRTTPPQTHQHLQQPLGSKRATTAGSATVSGAAKPQGSGATNGEMFLTLLQTKSPLSPPPVQGKAPPPKQPVAVAVAPGPDPAKLPKIDKSWFVRAGVTSRLLQLWKFDNKKDAWIRRETPLGAPNLATQRGLPGLQSNPHGGRPKAVKGGTRGVSPTSKQPRTTAKASRPPVVYEGKSARLAVKAGNGSVLERAIAMKATPMPSHRAAPLAAPDFPVGPQTAASDYFASNAHISDKGSSTAPKKKALGRPRKKDKRASNLSRKRATPVGVGARDAAGLATAKKRRPGRPLKDGGGNPKPKPKRTPPPKTHGTRIRTGTLTPADYAQLNDMVEIDSLDEESESDGSSPVNNVQSTRKRKTDSTKSPANNEMPLAASHDIASVMTGTQTQLDAAPNAATQSQREPAPTAAAAQSLAAKPTPTKKLATNKASPGAVGKVTVLQPPGKRSVGRPPWKHLNTLANQTARLAKSAKITGPVLGPAATKKRMGRPPWKHLAQAKQTRPPAPAHHGVGAS